MLEWQECVPMLSCGMCHACVVGYTGNALMYCSRGGMSWVVMCVIVAVFIRYSTVLAIAGTGMVFLTRGWGPPRMNLVC